MEPGKEVLKRTPEERKDGKKSRFQIVKLEERIVPGCHFNPNAGPPVTYGYGGRFKLGKYVGNC